MLTMLSGFLMVSALILIICTFTGVIEGTGNDTVVYFMLFVAGGFFFFHNLRRMRALKGE
jgi:hypothetical protein